MDFSLSPEQLLIKDSAARYAGEARDGADPWPHFAALGWLAIGAPEEAGGFGGPVETMLLMEQFGRGLVVAPYATAVVAAGAILARAGRGDLLEALTEGTQRLAVAYEERGARYDPSVVHATARSDGGALVVHGAKVRVLGAAAATTFLVTVRLEDGRVAIVAIPRSAGGITVTPFAAEDGHDVADVRFDGARVEASAVVVAGDETLATLERALDHATAALCAEALGLMAFMLDATVDYTKQRRQFGVAIGSFQALQHRMAEMFVQVELARSMATYAAMGLDTDDDAARRRAVSAAKVQIARSGRFVGQNAIQLHGGIGMSEEYRVGHYFKRMTIVERLLGDRTFHLARYRASAAVPARTPVTA